MALNKPNNEIDTSALAQENTSQEIKLSNESIKAVADEILSRMGLTNDTGGGTSTGSVFAKLNALLSTGGSGGITGFKYMDKTTSSSSGTTYTTQASGILLTDNGAYITSGGAQILTLFMESPYGDDRYSYIGLFQKGAKIEISRNGRAHIFEFI